MRFVYLLVIQFQATVTKATKSHRVKELEEELDRVRTFYIGKTRELESQLEKKDKEVKPTIKYKTAIFYLFCLGKRLQRIKIK